MGMGAAGVFLRPWDAVAIAALVLGGTFSNVNVWLGETIGALGLLLAVYLLFRAYRKREEWPPESKVLCAVLLFMVGCTFTMSAARISPEWLSEHPRPLPSRYLTFAFIFWSCALPLAVFDLKRQGSKVMAGSAILATGSLLLGFIPAQLGASDQWLRTYRLMDAAAAGFMVGALDQTYMSQMYPDNSTLARDVPYLREHRLSVFVEPRANWIGRKLVDVFRVNPEATCSGLIEVTTLTETGSLRLTGYVTGLGVSGVAKTDVVFTDSAGRIAGLGRTLLEDEHGGARFLGYAESKSGALTPWAAGASGEVCRLALSDSRTKVTVSAGPA